MNAYKELKLMVYESALSKDMIDDMIDLMESCDDEDLQEICEAVEELVTEANAYNKLANKYLNDHNKNVDKGNIYARVSGTTNNPVTKKAYDAANTAFANAIRNGINLKQYNASGALKRIHGDSLYVNQEDRNNYREYKQKWMHDHGNDGTTPEEKYKAGRYLKAQEKLKEIDKKYKR